MWIKEVEYKITESECWECTSHALAGKGYPCLQRNFKTIGVSHYMWINKYGDIPKGLHVLHKCDNRLCINPEHLYLGTNAQNMKDMAIRSRGPGQKISNDDVLVIREMKGIIKQKDIAIQYDVCVHHISDIWTRNKRIHI